MERIRGKQVYSAVYHLQDGFYFYLNKTTNSTKYYRCIEWKRGCLAKGTVRSDGGFDLTYQHNHNADPSRATFMTQRLRLINDATRLDVATVRDVFRDQNRINTSDLFEGELSYRSLYPAMVRARENLWPQPQNLTQLCDVLENPMYSCITATDMFADDIFGGVVRADPFRSALILMSKTCSTFVRMISALFITCTSIHVRGDKYKVYTISSLWEGNVIKIASLVVQSNIDVDHEILVSAFSVMKINFGVWHYPKVFCGNHIVASAFHEVFQVQVQPSFSDYIYDVKSFVDQAIPSQNPSLSDITQMCCALPIVPKDLLQLSIDVIVSEAQRSRVYNDSLILFNYLEVIWLKRAHFTMWDAERTSLGSVELNLKLENKIFYDFYSLIRFTKNLFNMSHQTIAKVMQGQTLPSQPCSLVNDNEILNLVRGPVSSWNVKNLLKKIQEKISHIV